MNEEKSLSEKIKEKFRKKEEVEIIMKSGGVETELKGFRCKLVERGTPLSKTVKRVYECEDISSTHTENSE